MGGTLGGVGDVGDGRIGGAVGGGWLGGEVAAQKLNPSRCTYTASFFPLCAEAILTVSLTLLPTRVMLVRTTLDTTSLPSAPPGMMMDSGVPNMIAPP